MDTDFDLQPGGLVALLGLSLIGIVFLLLAIRRGRTCPALKKLLPLALMWRATVFGYYAFWVLPYYGNGSDALNYHSDAIGIADLIRSGSWSLIDWGVNTKAMNIIFGLLYTPFGANMYGILVISAVIGFAGAIYFCLAFSLWVTPSQTRQYSAIILFIPSFALWTSIFGKDSWIALGVGLSAYGYSLIKRMPRSGGARYLILGVLLTTLVRPHIAFAAVLAMACAHIWSMTQRTKESALTRVFRAAMLSGAVAALYILTLNFVGISQDSAQALEEFARNNGEANARMGSSVVEVQVAPGIGGAIRAFPRGVVRVLFEPFPWEVHNLNAGLAAVENLFIAGFVLIRARRLRLLWRQIVRVPYFLYCAATTLALLAMFSFLPNLGLISRQRAQLLPFLFAVLVSADVSRKRNMAPVQPLPFPSNLSSVPKSASAQIGLSRG